MAVVGAAVVVRSARKPNIASNGLELVQEQACAGKQWQITDMSGNSVACYDFYPQGYLGCQKCSEQPCNVVSAGVP